MKLPVFNPLTLRNGPQQKDMSYRTLSVRLANDGTPATLDADNRSFEVIGATESPVEVFDYERLEVVPKYFSWTAARCPATARYLF